MARKDPYDPEEGIIDLFDIVDDPEASPEPEPRGALHDDGGQALPGQPEAAEPETPPGEESERVVSRYPFENSDDFLEEIEKTPLMTLLPPKDEASALPEEPVSDGAEGEAPAEILGEPVREEPDEALIRAFEAEMTKAGAVVHEYGVETAPGMADASGVPDETEAPALSTEAVDQEFAEMHPEAQESSVPEPAERTYAEDLELLFGDAPVADAPQVEPSPVAPEPAMEAPMLVSPEGEEGSKADPGSSQQAEAAPEGAAEEPSESLPSSVSADDVAEPLPEPSEDGTDRALASVPVAVPDVPVSAAEPQAEPSCGHEMEERIIRLEEALSRLNERVVALEQRADDAAEQDLNVSAISGDIQSLLTEGNALCGQLKSLAAELGSTPSGVPAEALEAAPLPGTSAEVAEEPRSLPSPPIPLRSLGNPPLRKPIPMTARMCLALRWNRWSGGSRFWRAVRAGSRRRRHRTGCSCPRPCGHGKSIRGARGLGSRVGAIGAARAGVGEPPASAAYPAGSPRHRSHHRRRHEPHSERA